MRGRLELGLCISISRSGDLSLWLGGLRPFVGSNAGCCPLKLGEPQLFAYAEAESFAPAFTQHTRRGSAPRCSAQPWASKG